MTRPVIGARAFTHQVPPAKSEQWTRPADWLQIDNLVTALDSDPGKVVGLHAVWPHGSNYVAVICQGDYTVDWGDGSTPVDVASDVQAEYLYDYSAISSDTDCSRGYRQVRVTITPRGEGVKLTSVIFDRRHSGSGSQAANTSWLDVRAAGSSIVSLVFYVNGTHVQPSANLEQFILIGDLSASWLDMSHMFMDCVALQTVPLFNTVAVTNMSCMFQGCYALQTIPLFNTAAVEDMSFMFFKCESLQSVPLFNTSAVKNMSLMLYACRDLQTVPLFNTAAVEDMSYMFYYCKVLQTVPLFDTSAVKNMARMFYGCSALQTVPLFNTAAVENMSCMFQYCYGLQTVPLFNTAAVTNMSDMLAACTSLQSVPLFNTVAVINMRNMLAYCGAIRSVPLFDTSAVTNMSGMLRDCNNLQDVPLFNTAAVTDMSSMFAWSHNLQNIPIFNTAAVTNMSYMLYRCDNLQIIPLLNTVAVTNMLSMFAYCRSLGKSCLHLPSVTHTYEESRMSKQDVLNVFGGASHNVPDIESIGNLTTRTSNTEGILTLDASHMLAPGAQTIKLEWVGGSRTGVTGTRVAVNQLTFTGGAGDDLPVETTVIAVSYAYQGLKSGVSGQTLTITGNPGAAELSVAEKAECTDKGWTLVI